MDIELVQAIQVVSVEAIKILGPAIVAGSVAYRVGKNQMETKLKELSSTHEFEARKTIHDLLVNRQERLHEGSKGIGESLGFVMGATSGGEEDADYVSDMVAVANVHLRAAQRAATLAKEYFVKKEFEGKAEYGIVESCIDKLKAMRPATDFATLKANTLSLFPIVEDLTHAQDRLIDWEMDEILSPYIAGSLK